MNVMNADIAAGRSSEADCTPEQIAMLAAEYRKAAHTLLAQGRQGEPLSRAPARLSAIHAIELYLNALLLSHGLSASDIRALQHDLAARTALALTAGLVLRKKTAAHLPAMTGSREYLITRYHPDRTDDVSEVTRLVATLDEVAGKVATSVSCRSGQR